MATQNVADSKVLAIQVSAIQKSIISAVLLQERSKIATFGPFRAEILCYNQGLPMTAAWVVCVGEWLSLVEHLVRDQGVGGSNPLSPTIQNPEKIKDF